MKRTIFFETFFLIAIGVVAFVFLQQSTAKKEVVCPIKKCCETKCTKPLEETKENILHNPMNHFIV